MTVDVPSGPKLTVAMLVLELVQVPTPAVAEKTARVPVPSGQMGPVVPVPVILSWKRLHRDTYC